MIGDRKPGWMHAPCRARLAGALAALLATAAALPAQADVTVPEPSSATRAGVGAAAGTLRLAEAGAPAGQPGKSGKGKSSGKSDDAKAAKPAQPMLPPLDPLLGVPPPDAGLVPTPDDFLRSGRGLDGDVGDPAFGAYQRGYYLTAFRLALERARVGDPISQTLVARIYQDGLTGKQSDKAAAAWYQKAALAGDPAAQLQLGLLYLDGRGVKKDKAKAADAFEQAAAWNDRDALYNLGLIYLEGSVRPRDPLKAAGLFSRAAAQGSPDAQYALGELYAVGDGVVLDDDIATMWLAKAAKAGHIDAEVEYAIRLFNGTGTPKDEAAAAMWFRKAAKSGSAIAQNRYARQLAIGAGVPQDRIEAATWHLIAAEAGAKDEWLDDFVGRLTDGDRKKAEAAAADWSKGSGLVAAGSGNAFSQSAVATPVANTKPLPVELPSPDLKVKALPKAPSGDASDASPPAQ